MSNCLLSFPNRADDCTLSGGSWSGTLPLNNLKTRPLKQVARSTSAATVNTQFTAALATDRAIGVVLIKNHNFSLAATYRVQIATDAGFTAVVYDSGTLSVFADGVLAYGTVPWEDTRFWAGGLSAEELAYYPSELKVFPPMPVWGRYIKVEITDTTNAAGYVQIGRLFVGDGLMPAVNMSYGASIGNQSRTQVVEALDGAEFFDRRAPYRVVQISLDWLATTELASALDMQRQLDVHGEVLFVWDKDDPPGLMLRRSFLGRVRQLSAIENPLYELHSLPIEIKELL